MSDILQRILETKRGEIEAGRKARPLAEIEHDARAAGPARGFEAALRRDGKARRAAVIAEIKRASPSRGMIRADFDVATTAVVPESHRRRDEHRLPGRLHLLARFEWSRLAGRLLRRPRPASPEVLAD